MKSTMSGQRPSAGTPAPTAPVPGDTGPLPPPLAQGKSRWVPVHWSELPGFDSDALHEAWNAWIKGCERPAPAFAPLCAEVRRLCLIDRAASALESVEAGATRFESPPRLRIVLEREISSWDGSSLRSRSG